MPILRKESDIHPPDLFAIPTAVAPWEVAHVRSRQEKALVRHLARKDVPFYLPQVERKSRRSGRTFTSHLPLFPGYVFIRRTPEAHEAVWGSGVVAGLIPVADQELLARELEQLRSLQESGAVLIPQPDIVPGDAVRITDGVFKGYTGVVVEERGPVRLVISVTALRRSIVVEFPRDVLVPAKAASGSAPH